MDLVEGVAQREALDRVGDVAVEHADAADGGVVRHTHLHIVTVTAPAPAAAQLLTPHSWLLATIAISPAHRVPWLLAESLTHTQVEQTTHDTAFHCFIHQLIGVNGNVA